MKNGEYLHSYMQARAKEEGMDYDLTAEFFQEAMEAGISLFFGVSVDEKGMPVSDDQEPSPGFLNKWKATLN